MNYAWSALCLARIPVLVASLALLVGGCGVNNIPSYEESAKADWSQVLNQYQRRADLIPNLVETVKGYAAQERQVLEEVTNARARATQVQVQIPPDVVTNPEAFKRFQEAQAQLTGALGRLLAVSERYPDLKSLGTALKDACPNGIDGYFENVGGLILDAVMLRMNAFGRMAFCGMISGYNGEPIPMTYPQIILQSRLKLQGFIVSEHMDVWPQALKELGTLVATGKLKYRETIAQGIESAPEAFLGLLKGKNFGKQLVKMI